MGNRLIKARSLKPDMYIMVDGEIWKTRVINKVLDEDKIQWTYDRVNKKEFANLPKHGKIVNVSIENLKGEVKFTFFQFNTKVEVITDDAAIKILYAR